MSHLEIRRKRMPIKRGIGLAKGTNKFVKKMLDNSPDFLKAAREVTQI